MRRVIFVNVGFVLYVGDGFVFLLLSKYNLSKECLFLNMECYFEDNFD